MDVSIVIVNYNVKEYIISCIESIYKHSNSNITFEIVVVDNNSIDDSLSALKKFVPKVNIIKNDYNAGYSIAANQGVKSCKGKYVFLLNPDSLLIEDSLSKLANIAKKQDNIGVIGPKLIYENGLPQQSYWRSPSFLNTVSSLVYLDFFNFKKNYKYIQIDKINKVDTVSGCALFIKKEVFERLDGFDENLFWMEDIDFCIRLRQAGYFTYFFNETEIIHFKGKSSKSNYKTAISNQLISKVKFFKKHHSRSKALAILFLIMFTSFIKSITFAFLSPFSAKYKSKMFAYIFTMRSLFGAR